VSENNYLIIHFLRAKLGNPEAYCIKDERISKKIMNPFQYVLMIANAKLTEVMVPDDLVFDQNSSDDASSGKSSAE